MSEQSIEEAWENLKDGVACCCAGAVCSGTGTCDLFDDVAPDARALALVVLEAYIADVDATAEADQLRGNPLEGAHYRAMRKIAEVLRRRIEALGSPAPPKGR